MSIEEQLNNLNQVNKIESIPVNRADVRILFNKARKKLNFVKSGLNGSYRDNYDNDNEFFSLLYDGIRIGLDSMLRLYGYKTKSSGGHHGLAFNLGSDILLVEIIKQRSDEEERERIINAYNRISGIIKMRHAELYEPIEQTISRADLTVLMDDVEFILNDIGLIIEGFDK